MARCFLVVGHSYVVARSSRLRGEHAQIALYSLAASCAELRSGEQIVRLTDDPERAAEMINKLKTAPGVVDAGWT